MCVARKRKDGNGCQVGKAIHSLTHFSFDFVEERGKEREALLEVK
jgi:hypothetical protein